MLHLFELIKKWCFKGVKATSDFMDTAYFGLLLAAVELCCYYLEIDLVSIIVISLFMTFALIFKKNLNCFICLLLFLSTMISLGKSPGNTEVKSNFYFQPEVYITCIVAASVPIVLVIYRLVKNFAEHKIEYNLMFISTGILCIAFFLNGVFSDTYTPLDAAFGIFMIFFFFCLFYALLPNLEINHDSLIIIAKQVAAFSLVPLIELCVFYIVSLTGGISFETRSILFLGWGNRNTIGMLLSIAFFFVLFLAIYEKKSSLKKMFIVWIFVVLGGVIASFSRQAYFALIVAGFAFLVLLFFKTKGKIKIICVSIIGGAVGIVLVGFLILCFTGYFDTLDKEIINGMSDGRITLWEKAIKAFVSYPLFGSGFYFIGGDPKVQLSNVMPYCCHNTVLQMLSACGLFGILCYLFYRFTTVKEIIKNYHPMKLFLIMTVFTILIMSLLDIHIFDLLGSAIYVSLLAAALAPYKDENKVDLEEKKIDTEEKI